MIDGLFSISYLSLDFFYFLLLLTQLLLFLFCFLFFGKPNWSKTLISANKTAQEKCHMKSLKKNHKQKKKMWKKLNQKSKKEIEYKNLTNKS